MTNKNTQIKNKMIRSHPTTDKAKLAGLEIFIHKEYPKIVVMLERFVLFTKGEDQYHIIQGFLTKQDVIGYNINNPDMILIIRNNILIFELDGKIHDIKTEKTAKRNKRYELNNIPYIVINEEELKLKLGVKHLTQNDINWEFKERFDAL